MPRSPLAIACLLVLVGCGPESPGGVVGGRDLSSGPDEDASAAEDLAAPDEDLATDDIPFSDGPSAYDDLGTSGTDAGQCLPPHTGAACLQPLPANAACRIHEDCGPVARGNGLDDDCNGLVDDGCGCTPGDVQPCFLGPPGKRRVGACADGTQTCVQRTEIETGWGDCRGSIGPRYESCDGLDNDCNGCVDDGLCCDGTLVCPGAVPDTKPFATVAYDGAAYYTGSAASWSWTVDGGPCDQLFKVSTGTPPQQSFAVTGAGTRTPTFTPALSGDYRVTFTATDPKGQTYSCSFTQHVVAPGVRFELCWDHTGTAVQGGADLDLHVHRPGTTTKWFSTKNGAMAEPNPDDCHFRNCTASEYVSPALKPAPPDWGYPNSPLGECESTPAGAIWKSGLGSCHSPRLDLDNVQEIGRPENTNIDGPRNGDTFRAMVHYYGQDNLASTTPVEQHPIVNVYCGGRLTATFGQAPNTLGPCPGPTCFNAGAGYNDGPMWRVADVTAQVDATGKTTGCTVTALHPPGTTKGYFVTINNNVY